MLIDELVEEYLEKYEGNPWNYLCSINPDLDHAKFVEISPSITLNINPSLSVEQEEKLCTIMRKDINDFSWDCNEMKGVHPSNFTNNIYIKEGCKLVCQL